MNARRIAEVSSSPVFWPEWIVWKCDVRHIRRPWFWGNVGKFAWSDWWSATGDDVHREDRI